MQPAACPHTTSSTASNMCVQARDNQGPALTEATTPSSSCPERLSTTSTTGAVGAALPMTLSHGVTCRSPAAEHASRAG